MLPFSSYFRKRTSVFVDVIKEKYETIKKKHRRMGIGSVAAGVFSGFSD